MKSLQALPFAALLLLVIPACAVASRPRLEEIRSGPLAFLEIGVTTRREALLTLGQPSATFENDEVLTWRLSATKDAESEETHIVEPETRDDLGLADWHRASISLVLVFSAEGLLIDFNLVPVK